MKVLNFQNPELLNLQLGSGRLFINKKTYYNSSNSAFLGGLSMESQPQNPDYRNNPETFTHV